MNDELRQQESGDLPAEFELCDEAGQVIGRFTPERPRLTYDEMMKTCPYTEVELEAFDGESGGRPLAEIWQSLDRSS